MSGCPVRVASAGEEFPMIAVTQTHRNLGRNRTEAASGISYCCRGPAIDPQLRRLGFCWRAQQEGA